MDVEFLDELIVRDMGDGKHWELTEDFSWSDDCDVITVPTGYITDFASVPRLFWLFFPRYGKYTKAAVIHDYLYSEGIGTKDRADAIFYHSMLTLGVNAFKAWVMYQAVSMGGKGNFK